MNQTDETYALCHRCNQHWTAGHDTQRRPICGGCRADEHAAWVHNSSDPRDWKDRAELDDCDWMEW
jgi:hypothetical protein